MKSVISISGMLSTNAGPIGQIRLHCLPVAHKKYGYRLLYKAGCVPDEIGRLLIPRYNTNTDKAKRPRLWQDQKHFKHSESMQLC